MFSANSCGGKCSKSSLPFGFFTSRLTESRFLFSSYFKTSSARTFHACFFPHAHPTIQLAAQTHRTASGGLGVVLHSFGERTPIVPNLSCRLGASEEKQIGLDIAVYGAKTPFGRRIIVCRSKFRSSCSLISLKRRRRIKIHLAPPRRSARRVSASASQTA